MNSLGFADWAGLGVLLFLDVVSLCPFFAGKGCQRRLYPWLFRLRDKLAATSFAPIADATRWEDCR